MSECTTSDTYTTPCVGSFTSSRIDTKNDRSDHQLFSVTSERHRHMWGEQNCLIYLEMAVGGIEPPSPRLTVRISTAGPPLPTEPAQCYTCVWEIGNVNLGLLMESFLSDVHTQKYTKTNLCQLNVTCLKSHCLLILLFW